MAKGRYFSTQFCLNKENIKMTWKLIGMITNRKKKSYIIIPKLLDNVTCYSIYIPHISHSSHGGLQFLLKGN